MTDTRDLANVPDLPELESVTAGGAGSLVLNVVAWVLVSLLAGGVCGGIYALARIGSRTTFSWMEFAAIAAVSAVVAATLMARTNWFDYEWTTDASGITIGSLFRERRVAWSEVIEATGKSAMGDKMTYTLRTSSGRLALSDGFGGWGGEIGASIFQHLRKYGKGDESLLSPGARTFWTPIPRDVPNEMDWHNPKPPDWSVTLAAVVILLILVPLAYFLGPRLDWGHAWNFLHQFAGGLIPIAYYKLRERLIAARSVSVRPDGIEMRTVRRMIYLPWREIGYVFWHQQHNTLSIGRSTYTDVAMIRYRPDDPASATLILSIIRQLRAAHHQPPVVIPKPLLTMLGLAGTWRTGAVADGAPVEVRPMSPRVLAVGVALMLLPAVLFALLWTRHRTLLPFGSYVFALPLITCVLTVLLLLRRSAQVYRANSEGIAFKSFGRSRFVRWEHVANYIAMQSSLSGTIRILKDSSGRTLLTLALPEGARPDIDLFLAYLDARLASVRQDNARVLMR